MNSSSLPKIFPDEETTYTQGGAVYQTWEDGMTFKLGFSYKW